MTTCPFKNNSECTAECELYIKPEDLNETMRNKLASIGVVSRDTGICSFKNMALAKSRSLFESFRTSY